LFDQDGNGYIESKELKNILGGSIENLDDETWKEMVSEVDTNGDGKISFEEFSQMMTNYADHWVLNYF